MVLWRCPPAVTLFLCLVEISCSKELSSGPAPVPLRINSTTMARLAEALKQMPEVTPQIVTANLTGLQQGKSDIAMVGADVAYGAFERQSREGSIGLEPLRGIAVLNVDTLYVMAAPHTRIKSIADLRGLRVAIGSGSSVTPIITDLLLRASGLSVADVQSQVLHFSETVKGLSQGRLDAAFDFSNAAVSSATNAGARLIDIQGSHIEQIREQHPFLQSTLVVAGTFRGQEKPLRTVGIDLLLVCRRSLEDDLVYRIVKTYFDVLQRSSPATDLERAPATPIPLHPGAARFYRERVLAR